MTRRTPAPEQPPVERIQDIDVTAEMQESFLEYAYSVIYSRALPDARDGLKPVQRRILFQMSQMGLRPDRGHVKSARVVGDVMGRLHPHGDGAIYDALVRMAQPFSLRLPMVDGHGNFGSLDDGPAAMRYTECRLDSPAIDMTASLDEDVVDFTANYDGRETEPQVLPAAIPNLLVNGAAGIAVGMATNMPPHNLVEVVAAARHLLAHPQADTADLMRHLPGPDLPSGGTIVGLDGIRDAYETGRGAFRMRAAATVAQLSPRRQGIVVTELPYNVGPERVIERIKQLVGAKKVDGIADLVDLTDGEHGLRLEIAVKNGFHPEAVLAQLYKATPLEEQFSVNAVALVNGQPRVLGLKDLLQVFLDHRIDVVRRRSQHRLDKAQQRLHLVEGLLRAIVDIDEVIALIRSSEDADEARNRLMSVFDLSQPQAAYILDMPLRRLTKYSRLELEQESNQLGATIEDLAAILGNQERLHAEVSQELADVAKRHGTPRRTLLLDEAGAPAPTHVPLEVADDPCTVLLSTTGLIGRTATAAAPPGTGPRGPHDVLLGWTAATARGQVGLVTSRGRLLRLQVLELPVLPSTEQRAELGSGAPLSALVDLPAGESAIGLVELDPQGAGFVLGTRAGVVKRVAPEVPASLDSWEVVRLAEGDAVVGAAQVLPTTAWLVFVTAAGQVLKFAAAGVRPQGRQAGGVAGVRLAPGDHCLAFGTASDSGDEVVVTVAGSSQALPGTAAGTGKVTPLVRFPAKGRATAGVRGMRLGRGTDILVLAWVGHGPAVGASASGAPVGLPEPDDRRDGPGSPVSAALAAVGGTPPAAPGQP